MNALWPPLADLRLLPRPPRAEAPAAPPFVEGDRFVGADGVYWVVARIDPPWGVERAFRGEPWPRTAFCLPERGSYPVGHFGDPAKEATLVSRHFAAEELARWLACGAVALL